MLSNILYGTATLTYGGLLLTARAAGERGEAPTFQVQSSGALLVTVTLTGLGAGSIVVQAPPGTTEAALRSALRASSAFKALAKVEQATGDGTASIAVPFTGTFVAAGGLQQHLATRLGITGWDDRDVLSTGAVVGLIFPRNGQQDRTHYDPDGMDQFQGEVLIAIALQLDRPFHEQNAVLDMFRRALIIAIKTFTHPDLITSGTLEWAMTNKLEDEAAGTVLEEARLSVVVNAGKDGTFKWQEEPFEPEDEAGDGVIHLLQFGLFREPLDDTLGPGGGEVLDTLLEVPLTP